MHDSEHNLAMRSLRRAVGLLGDQASFGALLGISQQAVSLRLREGTPLKNTAEVLAVEAATGVSRHDLRPDLYPREEAAA